MITVRLGFTPSSERYCERIVSPLPPVPLGRAMAGMNEIPFPIATNAWTVVNWAALSSAIG